MTKTFFLIIGSLLLALTAAVVSWPLLSKERLTGGPYYYKSFSSYKEYFTPEGRISAEEGQILSKQGYAFYEVMYDDEGRVMTAKKQYDGHEDFLVSEGIPRDMSKVKEFLDDWEWQVAGEGNSFAITLAPGSKSHTVRGSYCSIAFNGNKVDCDVEPEKERSLQGVLSEGRLILEILDVYGGGKGEADLLLNDDGSATWKLIEPPTGEHYLPAEARLVRVSE